MFLTIGRGAFRNTEAEVTAISRRRLKKLSLSVASILMYRNSMLAQCIEINGLRHQSDSREKKNRFQQCSADLRFY